MRVGKGTIVVFEEGEYSDRGVDDVGEALQDFDTDELVVAFLEEHPAYRDESHADDFGFFISWLAQRKYIKLLQPNLVWNIGNHGRFRYYGEIDPFRWLRRSEN